MITFTAVKHTHVSVRIHCVLLPPTITLAKAVQALKANSSRWLHQNSGRPFEWQEGYAAFSVGISQTDATVAYINNQPEHHAKSRFDEELGRMLVRHRMEA